MIVRVRLGGLGTTYGGLSGKTKADFGQGDAAYVTFLEVVNNVKLQGKALERVRVGAGENQNRVLRGDLLFNGSSETPEEVALSAVVDFEPGAETYLNSFCFGFRLQPDAPVDPAYLAYLFRAPAGRALVSSLAQGATRYNIAKTKLLDTELELPGLSRQQQIVAALSDADALAAALLRTIVKKEEVKQGMLQALLTGSVRLPGFTKPWVMRRLADILTYEQPGEFLVNTAKQLEVGRIPVLTAGKTFILGYTNDDHGIYTNHPVIIFDDFTTASKFVDFDFKAKSSAMKILTARPEFDARFLYERMQLIDFSLADHKRYWISEYSQQEIAVPDYPEQQALSRMIADCDQEISLLRNRLAKVRAVRQGMMQELLPGRTRLPTSEAAA